MAEAKVKRKDPVPQPIEEVTLYLTPDEAAIIYSFVAINSVAKINGEFETYRSFDGKVVSTRVKSHELTSIYQALLPHAKDNINLL